MMHFDRNQREMRRQDNWIRLKPNAIPTLFNITVKPPTSLKNENVYTDIGNIPVDDEISSPNPNYVEYKNTHSEMTNVTSEKPTTVNLDVVKQEIYDEIEDITVEELAPNQDPECNEVELKRKETSIEFVPKPTTRIPQSRPLRGTKRKKRNNGTFMPLSTTKPLPTTGEVEAEELSAATFTEQLDDNFDTFGKFIASELRTIHSSSSDQVLHRLKKRILNVLFDTWDTIDMPCATLNTPNLADHEYSFSNFP